uniref:WASH complex subunit 4 N-terminal domain-containing protein n=1 Tax=Glossina palpalis gambiensis TaxID=67801 RepID=A0A1B0BTZ9_9MUSC
MDQITLISSAEEQLKCFGNFLAEHDKTLEDILQHYIILADQQNSLCNEPLVKIDYQANREQLSLLRLLESDRLLNKVLLTFGYLCQEVKNVAKDAKNIQIKFLYLDEELLLILENDRLDGEDLSVDKLNNERLLLKMSESMEFLCQMQFLFQRCILLGNNLLHQSGALLANEKSTNCIELKLTHVCDYLSELFYNILIFDQILYRSNFSRFWPAYKKTVEAIGLSGSKWRNCSPAEFSGLENCLQELDILFTGCLYQHFLESSFNLKERIGPTGLGQLTQQFNDYLRQQLQRIDKFNNSVLNEFSEANILIKLNAFCVVFHDFCGQVDSKALKHLLELNSKHTGIMLIANIPWSSSDFLRKNAFSLVKPHLKLMNDLRKEQQLFLNTHAASLSRDCRSYCSQITLWILKMNKILNVAPFDLKMEQFKELTMLLNQGIDIAGQVSFLIKGIVNCHEGIQIPMTKPSLLTICKLIELLKMIQLCLRNHTANIAKIINCLLQYFQYKILHLLSNCKKKLISSKLAERGVDALAALKICERCLHGPPSKARILVAKLAFDASCNVKNRSVTQEQQERFRNLMQRIEIMAEFQLHIEEIGDASFLCWHQSILQAYLKQIVDKKLDFQSFQYLISSADECVKALKILGLKDLNLFSSLEKFNFENIRSEIISKLCAQIEIFLRLDVHSSLQLEKINPFDQGIDDYKKLINICPLAINGNYVLLKDHVENYLSAMFYNLTTISLHDWKTYEEMRHLANKRLILRPVEDYLPNQTLEQGIDILEIMRKIHIFVSKYVYNMNSQIFVEQQSNNKHLDTIGIKHMANSLRTHGTGVINTTVNFTYQFLRQKFYTFSQFLYDEQIKSRLMKELRSFAERKHTDKYPLYPYERADNFNKDIRKLGLTQNGQTYMDLFRNVITQVGNAMGYIRLVRSGSIHANYSASLYLPKFADDLNFVQNCHNQNLSEVTQNAAENLETNIQNLAKCFADNTDYFKLLIDAFQPFFRNPNNLHLKTFYLIVPALTMNYVEHMLAMKAKINKKEREEVILFDDGFPVGLAYVLKLLNQIGDFNTLQWFATIRDRFEMESRKIKEMLLEINNNSKQSTKSNTNALVAQKSENEKLQQTFVLTERRINAHQMEYNLLYYNLCSAKIFFQ